MKINENVMAEKYCRLISFAGNLFSDSAAVGRDYHIINSRSDSIGDR
jgi:hypothetical protein